MPTTPPPPPTHCASPSRDDAFVLLALGVDLTSHRLCIGEVIANLMDRKGPSELINMLVAISRKVGLSASLNDAFGKCTEFMKAEDEDNLQHARDVTRLERVADAALFINCARKARKPEQHSVTPVQVRRLMTALSLKPSKKATRIDDIHKVPRGKPNARSLAYAVLEACGVCKSRHIADMTRVLQAQEDAVLAVSSAMRLCIADTKFTNAFLLIHGHDIINAPSLFESMQDGSVAECGVGTVLEAEHACMMAIKFRSADSCLVTPLVRK